MLRRQQRLIKKEHMSQLDNNLKNSADKTKELGRKLTKKVTLPIILGIVGLLTFPLGIVFWVIAIGIIFSEDR